MGGAGRPVHEERPRRRLDPALADHRNRLIGHVAVEVVVRLPGGAHRRLIADQGGVPVIDVGGEEAVEPVEPLPGRPLVIGSGRSHVFGDEMVPLAKRISRIALRVEIVGKCTGRSGDFAVVARKGPRHRRVAADADAVRHAPGEERGPRRRADRGGMVVGVTQAPGRDPVDIGRLHQTAIAGELGETDVVQHPDEDIGALLLLGSRGGGSRWRCGGFLRGNRRASWRDACEHRRGQKQGFAHGQDTLVISTRNRVSCEVLIRQPSGRLM